MSYVIAAPEMMTSAATDLATIGSDLSAAHTAAAAPTLALIPAAADEVSASIAHLFSRYVQDYQALAGKAAAFHQQFVHNLTAGGGSYASIEADIASFLRSAGSSSFQSASITRLPTEVTIPLISAIAWFITNAIAKLPSILQTFGSLIMDPTFLLIALEILFFPITIPVLLVEFIALNVLGL
ncbi:MAG: PE family protein [Mycobacterium sp.]|uniref:PE family protein n=1 Tax=Mycobacterium sp. TaxID=1785 RepID=UPI003C4D60D1